MLLIIRLTKDTTSSVKYTIPKEIRFNKLTFKGYSWERCDNLAANEGLAPATNSELPVYMSCDFLGDNEVLFLQGKNQTIRSAESSTIELDNAIPLGGIREGQVDEGNYCEFNLPLIDRSQVWEVGKEISITLFQIHKLVPNQLTNNQAFGAITDDSVSDPAIPGSGPSPIDHGINLYFSFDLDSVQNVLQSYNVADGVVIS